LLKNVSADVAVAGIVKNIQANKTFGNNSHKPRVPHHKAATTALTHSVEIL